MPSWPTRLFLGTFTPNNSSNHGQPPTESGNPEGRLYGTNHSVIPSRSPALSPSNSQSGNPIPRRTSQHGRSISHPFPSIFSSGKKRNARDEEEENVIDAKTLHMGSPGPPATDQSGFSRIGSAQCDEAELLSGKCATCNSHVRWPRHLNVYRCTVCLMVNDLKHNFPKPAVDGLPVQQSFNAPGPKPRVGSPIKGT